jgi:hypothetical protein
MAASSIFDVLPSACASTCAVGAAGRLHADRLTLSLLKFYFQKSGSLFSVSMCQGTVLYHTLKIYIYLIESPPAVIKINIFKFFYIQILIRQKVYKILLFCENF